MQETYDWTCVLPFCPLCKKKGNKIAHSKHCDENPLSIAARLAREATKAAILAHVAAQPNANAWTR